METAGVFVNLGDGIETEEETSVALNAEVVVYRACREHGFPVLIMARTACGDIQFDMAAQEVLVDLGLVACTAQFGKTRIVEPIGFSAVDGQPDAVVDVVAIIASNGL